MSVVVLFFLNYDYYIWWWRYVSAAICFQAHYVATFGEIFLTNNSTSKFANKDKDGCS